MKLKGVQEQSNREAERRTLIVRERVLSPIDL